MLYEQYALKIKKYADIRDTILRYKALILTVLCVILALTAAFLAVNGMIIEGVSGNEEYVFGQTPKFTAKALFSSVSFEYSSDGEQWTENAPSMPGEYYARAVSKRSFGIKGHSDAYAFSILKKDARLTIVEDTIQWRMQPTVEAEGLLGSHSLSEVRTAFENEGIGENVASVLTDTVKIVNSEGEDVTGGYALLSEPKAMTVVARELTVRANNVTKTYDGEVLTDGGYEIISNDIAEGHTILVTFKPLTLRDAGKQIIEIDEVKVFDGDDDVTAGYYITAEDGVGTINKRAITVKSDGAFKKYDGKALDIPDWYITGDGLVAEHTIKVDAFVGEIITPDQSVAEHIIAVDAVIDGDGNNVTDNYEISIENSALTVSKRTLNVVMKDQTLEYDGKEHTPVVEVSGAASGQTAVVDANYGSFTAPVKIEDYVGGAGVYVGDVDVTDCYDIRYDLGTFEITKRKLTVTVDQASKVYDGTPLDVKISYSGNADGHEVLTSSDYGEIIAPTSSPITDYLSARNIVIMSGAENVTDFYDITVVNGELSVKIKTITIIVTENSKEYDGTPLEVEITEDSVADGHKLEYTINYSEIIKPQVINDYIDVDSVRVMNGEEDVTGCYDIIVVNGKLTVTKKKLTITVTESTKEYDGTPLEVEIKNNAPVKGHSLSYKVNYFEIITPDVITDYIDADSVLIMNGAENVTDCYDITVVNGKLTVTKRTLTVKVHDSVKQYDGTPLNVKVTHDDALEGDTVYFVVNYNNSQLINYTGKGITDYVSADKVTVWRDGVDITAYYNVVIDHGDVRIDQREIVIVTEDVSKIYDTNKIERGEATAYLADMKTPGLVGDDSIKAVFLGSYYDAGTYVNELSSASIYSGGDISDNYIIIEYVYGELTIEKRKINVTLKPLYKVYDGQKIFLNDNYPEITYVGGRCGVETLYVYLNYSYINYCEATNYAEYIDYYMTQDDINNYDVIIDATYATVQIDKRDLYITAEDLVVDYRGTDFEASEFLANGIAVDGLASGHSIAIYFDSSVNSRYRYAGLYSYSLIQSVYDTKTLDTTVINNYNIIREFTEADYTSNITINKLKLTFTVSDFERDYNGKAVSYSDVVTQEGEIANVDYFSTFKIDTFKNAGVYTCVLYYDITGEDGYSALDNYDITVIYTNGDHSVVTINKVKITVYANDFEKDYDSIAVKASELVTQEGSVVSGEKLTISLKETFVNAGVYSYELSCVFSSPDNYDLTVVYTDADKGVSKITINKATIVVDTLDYVKTYDGNGVLVEDVIEAQTGDAVSGENFILFLDKVYKHADTYDYSLLFAIIKADGTDGKDNYDVIINYTTPATKTTSGSSRITIKKAKLTVYAYDYTKEYDGELLVVGRFSELYLHDATNDSFSISVVEHVFDAGEYWYSLKVEITDNGGVDVSASYDIEMVYTDALNGRSKITITKRQILVATDSYSWEYDGKAHYIDNVTVFHMIGDVTTALTDKDGVRYFYDTLGGNGGRIDITDTDAIYYSSSGSTAYYVSEDYQVYSLNIGYALANGEEVSVTDHTEITNLGKVENVILFDILGGSNNMNGNYEIVITVNGTLEITQRGITVTTATAEKVYDGKDGFSKAEVESADGLLEELGHTIEFVLGTQTVTGIDVGSVDNVFEIRIFDAQHNDITEYYDVEYVYGKLSVIKRTVNVYAKSANKEYDGTPLVAPGIAEDGVDGLVDGHSYDESELYSMGFLLGVGTVENQLAGRIIILDADGVDVTANYDPVLVSGVLTVTWTTIEISMYGGEATYTGEAVYSTKAKVTDGALADGDRIIFVRNGGFVDVGTHTGNYVVIAVIKTKLGYLIYEADAQGAYERVDPTKDMYVYLRHTDAYLKISVNDEVSLYYDVPKDNNYRISEYGIVYGINGPASPKPYTINPIKIVIQCDSESKSQSSFSSSERVAVTGGYTIAEGKLLDGHYIRAYTEGEATPSNPEAVNTIDASTIRFYSDKSLSVDSEITDEVKDCYVIEIIDGTLTLTP